MIVIRKQISSLFAVYQYVLQYILTEQLFLQQ